MSDARARPAALLAGGVGLVVVGGCVVSGVVVVDCDVVLASPGVDGAVEVADVAGSDVGESTELDSGSSGAGVSAVHPPRARHTTTAADAVGLPGVRRLMGNLLVGVGRTAQRVT